MKKAKILTDLALTFLKISAFTFGGGYAMISIIDNECVEKKKWITPDEFMDMTVLAESTPGPIAINCATYVGYKQAGAVGSVVSTIAMVIPSFIIIFLISLFFDNILEIGVIANAFRGIRTAVGVLILSVGLKMLGNMKKMKRLIIIMCCALIAVLAVNIFKWSFSSIFLILLAGLAGYLIFVVEQIKSRGGESEK